MLHESGPGGQAIGAQTETDHLRGGGANVGEVVKIIVMNPEPSRDLTARAADRDHAADRFFVAEFVEIDLRVIAQDRQVSAITRAAESIPREANVNRSGANRVF